MHEKVPTTNRLERVSWRIQAFWLGRLDVIVGQMSTWQDGNQQSESGADSLHEPFER